MDRRHGTLAGISLVLAGTIALAGMDGIGKSIVEDGVSVFQMLAIRGWIIVPLLLAGGVFRSGGLSMRTRRPIGNTLRVIAGIAATVFFFLGVREIPLGNAVVIFFCAPILMTAFSAIILREPVGLFRWIAIVAGFIGVVVAMRPGTEFFQSGSLYVFIGSCAYASIGLFNRWLGDTEPTFRLVLYFNVAIMAFSTAVSPFVWTAVPVSDLGSLAAFALVAIAGHILVTAAYRRAPVSAIAPFEYTTIIWAIMFGIMFWDDALELHTIVGAFLIAASGIAVIHHERRSIQDEVPIPKHGGSSRRAATGRP